MPTFTLTSNDDVLDDSAVPPDGTVDTIFGLAGNDSIFSSQGDDLIYGGDGEDTISSNTAVRSATGGDTVFGGAGDDVITTQPPAGAPVFPVGDTVYGGTGNDSIVGARSSTTDPDTDSLFGGDGNDVIDGNGGDDSIDAGAGNDHVITRAQSDTTDGGDGIDTIDFSHEDGPVLFDMATGATTVSGDVETNVNYENAIGSAMGDSLTGTDAANTLAGGAGEDLLEGGFGDDVFMPGADNDTVVGGEDPGGDDIDVLDYADEVRGVRVDYTGTEAGTVVGVGAATDTFTGIERFVLSEQDDAFDAFDDTQGITLEALGGNDSVAASQAADTMDGGDGDDLLSYRQSGAPVSLGLAGGTGSGGTAEGDTFTNFEQFELSPGNDTATGSTGSDTVLGARGDDLILGQEGADSLSGNLDNDTVRGGEGGDSMDGGSGIDTLDYSTSAAPVTVDLASETASGGDAEGDSFVNFENVTGTSGNDSITGSLEANTIDAGAGDDVALGLSDDDVVYGGDGDDALYGGEGNDLIDGGAGNDDIYGGAGTDRIYGGDDQDTVWWGPGDGSDFVIGGEGGADNDTLVISGARFDVDPDAVGPGDDESGAVTIFGEGGAPDRTIQFAEIENVVCFTRGTMIGTPHGPRPIEEIGDGDLVLTRDRGAQPVRWIGSQTVAAVGKLAPVVIARGALGNDRDLVVSQLHRMLITDWRAELMFDQPEVLAAAKHLVNGDTIYVREGGEVEYFHMLFDRHEIVTANGTAAESFHPGEQGMSWMDEAVREEIFAIFPVLRARIDGFGPSARTSLKAYEVRALVR